MLGTISSSKSCSLFRFLSVNSLWIPSSVVESGNYNFHWTIPALCLISHHYLPSSRKAKIQHTILVSASLRQIWLPHTYPRKYWTGNRGTVLIKGRFQETRSSPGNIFKMSPSTLEVVPNVTDRKSHFLSSIYEHFLGVFITHLTIFTYLIFF